MPKIEVLLAKYESEEPFVIKKGKKSVKYFIEGVEYTDDVDILLNAIKNVKKIDYSEFCKCYTEKELNKASYWQYYFNYQWNKGGLILWHNPTQIWRDEQARKGELKCETCGGKMTMYYRSYCAKCEKPTPDKKGRYYLHEIAYYLAAKHDLPERSIIDGIVRSEYFNIRNDSPLDLHFTRDKSVDKWLRYIDAEYPLETTNFYISW